MTTYIDTSAFIALLDADASEHTSADSVWKKLLDSDEILFTSNYVVVETCALLQRRAGLSAVRIFLENILPVVTVEWVDHNSHDAAAASLLLSGRRGPNIVDCVSFVLMHKLHVNRAFAFDRHFADQGFVLVGSQERL